MKRLKVIYVDVDDTLIRTSGGKRIPIPDTAKAVKRLKESGAILYCWSAGGAEYSREVAEELKIAECFQAFLPKPDIMIDDLSPEDWGITILHPNEVTAL